MTSQREENHQALPSKLGSWIQQNAKWVQAIPALYPLARIVRRLMLGPLPSGQRIEAELNPPSGPNFRLLIVSPPSWHSDIKPFEPATGHFYFDLWQSAREFYNSEDIHWTQVKGGNLEWISNLLNHIHLVSPSHLLIHVEENPTGNPRDLAHLAIALRQNFTGWVTLLMYDSIYWNHLLAAEEFIEHYPRTNVIATDGELRLLKRVGKAGPALLPTSKQSLRVLESRYANDHRLQPTYDVSHIGSLYGYRRKEIAKLTRLGVEVVLNPHRQNPSEMPEYYEFYRAFRNSKITLNFSRANGANVKHAKTRILEATVFGSILLTDEIRLTSRLLEPSSFLKFSNARTARAEVLRLLSNPEALEQLRISSTKAGALCRDYFWRVFTQLNDL